MELNKYIDHTLLKSDCTEQQIEVLCQEAIANEFASVCVNPAWVNKASELLAGTDVKVCTVIGFPLGSNTTEVKAFETKNAVENGATEIDMVINVSDLKAKKYDKVENDIKQVVANANSNVVKVIVETCLLTDEEKAKVCEIVLNSGADFIKTSTGMSTGGATVEDISLFNSITKGNIGIKASGGVRTKDDALKMIEAGATRIGTSGGVQIVNNEENTSSY